MTWEKKCTHSLFVNKSEIFLWHQSLKSVKIVPLYWTASATTFKNRDLFKYNFYFSPYPRRRRSVASSPPGRYRPLATGPPLSAPPHPLRRTAGPLSVWTPRGCAAVARRRQQIPVAAQRRRRRCLEYKACPCRTAVTL